MFVATGLSGVVPLIHGLIVFGTSQMIRKAFLYTLAKAGCLLSGTSFYAVSSRIKYIGDKLTLINVILKTGFPKVNILANLTYWAPIQSFTSW